MAVFPNAGFERFICSIKKVSGEAREWFITGFAGYGWKIWEWMTGRYKLEIDDLVVRRTMTVFELLISKIRSIAGALTISQAHGKIKVIDGESDPDNYLITLEETNSFVEGDFIRMEEWSGGRRWYWVKVSEIRGETVVIPKSEFEGASLPEIGDEMVQFGNETNTARQAALYLHVDEGGSPAIDLMRGINSKSFAERVKLRIGGSLPTAADEYNGLYAENGMLVFTDAQGKVTSRIWPNGTAEFGSGSFIVRPDKSGYLGGENGLRWNWDTAKNKFICTFGSDAKLKWDNLSDETKEELKGEPGEDGPPGVPGIAGEDGITYYTWIRYADTSTGGGMSNSPSNKLYMGLAHNKRTSVESNNPSDYTWSRFRGEDGTDGVPGSPGKDGKTLYTWIAYSDNANGSNMYQIPNENTRYIGIAVNKDTAIESNNPNDYTWSLFRGGDGTDANLLPWIEDWEGRKTEIDGKFIVSPKMFSGTKLNGELTGVALGHEVVTIGGQKKTGLFGIKNGVATFSLDSTTGDAYFSGTVEAKSGKIGDWYLNGGIITSDPSVENKINLNANNTQILITSSKITSTYTSGGEWSEFSYPSLWNQYGQSSNNSAVDGYEYIYCRTTNNSRPSTPDGKNWLEFLPNGWTRYPQGVNSTYQYEWMSRRYLKGLNSTIKLNANDGLIEAKNDMGVTYMTPGGIYSSWANTDAVYSLLGKTKKASIVGLGDGNLDKNQWDNENFIAGVYGTANNRGTAPAYGGFFQNLMAAGLFFNVKYVRSGVGSVDLNNDDYPTIVVGYSGSRETLYLPSDAVIGRVLFVRQWWSGEILIQSKSGQNIYYGTNKVTSFRVVSGETAMCVFVVAYTNNVREEVWLVNSFKTGA